MLSHLFQPKSVAVVGASRDEDKVGHALLRNILQYGYEGTVYPINPKADEILGIRCYASVDAVPGKVDLAILVVPAGLIDTIMDQCAEKGVAAAIVISAGFKESGREGARLERALSEKVRAAGIRMLGPNCLGLIDTESRLNASFARGMPEPGNIGFFSQSGALCTAILDWALGEGIGFSKFVSLGNKADIDEVDLLRFMGEDPSTNVILGYIEGVKDGREFMRAANEVSKKKPIVLTKAGGTEAGARAASSHTGTLAGSDKAIDAAFAQSGIIRARTVQELLDMATAFSTGRYPKGPKLAIVTNAGGPAIIAADAVERSEVRMATFAKETIDELRAHLPPTAALYNPVDVIGDANAERYGKGLEIVLADRSVDGALVILTPQAMSDPEDTGRAVAALVDSGKPVVASFMGGESVRGGINAMKAAGIPNYHYPERAVAAFEALVKYEQWRNAAPKKAKRFKADRSLVKKAIAGVLAEGRRSIGERDTREIISAYGFQVPKSVLASTAAEAVTAAEKLGFPIVMKIASPDILHKSDIGGVKVGLEDAQEVESTFLDMKGRARRLMPEARLDGVLVQEMVSGGKEVILGMSKDPQFGPMLMFGLGGIYVEVLKDVTFRIAPINRDDAHEMVTGIRSYALLSGVRGEQPVDVRAIEESLLRLSQLVTDFPEIVELDINPLAVFPKGRNPVAIDARLTIEEGE
jgi:acetyl coenzyme A synthetase (ADP forming)-like protein